MLFSVHSEKRANHPSDIGWFRFKRLKKNRNEIISTFQQNETSCLKAYKSQSSESSLDLDTNENLHNNNVSSTQQFNLLNHSMWFK